MIGGFIGPLRLAAAETGGVGLEAGAPVAGALLDLGLERQLTGHTPEGQPELLVEMAQDPQRPALVVGDVPALGLEGVGR